MKYERIILTLRNGSHFICRLLKALKEQGQGTVLGDLVLAPETTRLRQKTLCVERQRRNLSPCGMGLGKALRHQAKRWHYLKKFEIERQR